MYRLVTVLACLLILASCSGLVQRAPVHMGERASSVVKECRSETYRPGAQFPEHLRDKIAAEYWALEGPNARIPVELNDEVKGAIDYLLTEAPRFMTRSLGRSQKYMPMIQGTFRKKGLPADLAYLALIESGYQVSVISPAGAGGIWQFIPGTARRYGLIVDEFVDERFHPEKATEAAADYLKELHQMFGTWPLATAAYNCGEGKIDKGLKRYKAETFWDLQKQEGFLRDETRGYVPKFLAAIIIAKDPAKYGITGIVAEKPDEFDEVQVAHPTDLDVIARLTGTKVSVIEDLNPHLKLWCTPLFQRNYPVKVPKGTAEKFYTQYAKLKPEDCMKTTVHTVQSGENLKKIAALYQLSGGTLKRYNKLRSVYLRSGQKIKLPVDKKVYAARIKEYQARLAAERRALEKSGNRIVYKVRSGDNPWLIAKRFDIHWKDIAVWNDIKDVRKLMPGDELVLYLGPSPQPATSTKTASKTDKKESAAKEKSKETRVASIESDQRVGVAGEGCDLPGKKPLAATAQVSANVQQSTYTVESGDSLWSIARKLNVTVDSLRKANGLEGNRLKIGQVLKVPGAAPAKKPEKIKAKEEEIVRVAEKSEPAKEASKPVAPIKPVKAATSTVGGSVHTVEQDETVWRISQKYGVTPEVIRAVNNMKDNSIKPGQVLNIPAKGTVTVKTDDSPKKDVSHKADAGQKTTKVAYTVKNGDTLWKISQRFKVNPEQIREWNSMKDNSIKPGDVLTIHKPS
jgi:membrane-bound lytic murein transglycosylase D